MSLTPVGDSDFFFVTHSCHVDQFTFHKFLHSQPLLIQSNLQRSLSQDKINAAITINGCSFMLISSTNILRSHI